MSIKILTEGIMQFVLSLWFSQEGCIVIDCPAQHHDEISVNVFFEFWHV